MKSIPWMVCICLVLAVSCSGSKSSKKINEQTPQIELSDADEFIENPEQNGASNDQAPTEDVVVSNTEPLVQESGLENTQMLTNVSGTLKQYTVKKNETLMMIAFKLFGDYGKWKSLASQNAAKLKGGSVVRADMVLDYQAPAEEFVWNPQGNPYLIKTGDTLGHISKEVYATVKKWKLLWENNRPLVKDPNKIYAGFTIYYLEGGREVASQK
jgi:nucleoid-associated protein YgaU